MHEEMIGLTIAGLGVLGLSCQWLAWRMKLPAILLLLMAGLIIGPVTGVFNPNILFGDLLFPLISLSVAVILFEGSLTLNFDECLMHLKMEPILLSLLELSLHG